MFITWTIRHVYWRQTWDLHMTDKPADYIIQSYNLAGKKKNEEKEMSDSKELVLNK